MSVRLPKEHDPTCCAVCAAQGDTCCTLRPGAGEQIFPISAMEWDRIMDFTGDKGAFVEGYNDALFRASLKRLFPRDRARIDELFPDHKPHRRLATGPDGHCAFLGAEGCTLPREARPYFCLVFPLWIFDDRVTMFTPPHCVAVNRGRNPQGVLAQVGMEEGELRMLFGRLRLAWGLAPEPVEPASLRTEPDR